MLPQQTLELSGLSWVLPIRLWVSYYTVPALVFLSGKMGSSQALSPPRVAIRTSEKIRCSGSTQ